VNGVPAIDLGVRSDGVAEPSAPPEVRPLVEHFFRHEAGRLTAVLLKSLGPRHLELAEDAVQQALARAITAWRRHGVPDDPAGWLYRTARNEALDQLRRERLAERARRSRGGAALAEEPTPEPVFEREIRDEPLRLLFLCAHEELPAESRVALALKTLGGFSVAEVAAGLMITPANAERRISRAREKLRELPNALEFPAASEAAARADSVRTMIHLLFTEGHHAACSREAIRRDLCDEAIRLGRMLADHELGRHPPTFALLALMLFHAARLESRVGDDGAAVLLDDQDRSRWDGRMLREGLAWLARSATGGDLSRYHVEAAIAWEHIRAEPAGEGGPRQPDWRRIEELYGMLERIAPSPAVTLNRAVAIARLHGPEAGLARLPETPPAPTPESALWHGVRGALLLEAGRREEAAGAFVRALALGPSPADRPLLERRLAECRADSTSIRIPLG
jgi:RNA polymerase sigma-70 factor (ECF subfamily)